MRMTIVLFIFALLVVAAGLAVAQDRPRAERDAPDAEERDERLPLPRTPNDAVDLSALRSEISRRVAAGATDIDFRVDSLTQAEVRRLLLNPDPKTSLLVDIGARLPNDGVERSVRFRGDIEARVQRDEEGGLRLRIENINLDRLSAAQRAEIAEKVARTAGLERVRIRGTANGERVRVEFREGRGIVRNEGPSGARDARAARQGDRAERMERSQRAERTERAERADRAERSERVERLDRSGSNSGRH